MLPVGGHFRGEKNGRRFGRTYGIAAMAAEKRGEIRQIQQKNCEIPESGFLWDGRTNIFNDQCLIHILPKDRGDVFLCVPDFVHIAIH